MNINAQENIFTQFFATSVYYNPAFSGDCRFGQIATVNRIQPTTSQITIYNYSISYDQKMLNQHSGINISIDQKNAIFKETRLRLNYSYTIFLTTSLAAKGGIGLSFNSINTDAGNYQYPDQFGIYGYLHNTTLEPSIHEKTSYPGMSSGFVLYSKSGWFSAGIDNINLSSHSFAGENTHVPIILALNGGYFFAFDKDKRAKRYFDRDGGLNPYSSIGPVVTFYKQGPFQVSSIGLQTFAKPIFGGLSFRYNAARNHLFSDGVSSLNILAGYRNQSISVAYSYDFITNRKPTNYNGAHEISLIFYLFTIKEDYKKQGLIPFPNQLMY
jgi:type IX secretion system PorP/SprF family membrane protein